MYSTLSAEVRLATGLSWCNTGWLMQSWKTTLVGEPVPKLSQPTGHPAYERLVEFASFVVQIREIHEQYEP